MTTGRINQVALFTFCTLLRARVYVCIPRGVDGGRGRLVVRKIHVRSSGRRATASAVRHRDSLRRRVWRERLCGNVEASFRRGAESRETVFKKKRASPHSEITVYGRTPSCERACWESLWTGETARTRGKAPGRMRPLVIRGTSRKKKKLVFFPFLSSTHLSTYIVTTFRSEWLLALRGKRVDARWVSLALRDWRLAADSSPRRRQLTTLRCPKTEKRFFEGSVCKIFFGARGSFSFPQTGSFLFSECFRNLRCFGLPCGLGKNSRNFLFCDGCQWGLWKKNSRNLQILTVVSMDFETENAKFLNSTAAVFFSVSFRFARNCGGKRVDGRWFFRASGVWPRGPRLAVDRFRNSGYRADFDKINAKFSFLWLLSVRTLTKKREISFRGQVRGNRVDGRWFLRERRLAAYSSARLRRVPALRLPYGLRKNSRNFHFFTVVSGDFAKKTRNLETRPLSRFLPFFAVFFHSAGNCFRKRL